MQIKIYILLLILYCLACNQTVDEKPGAIDNQTGTEISNSASNSANGGGQLEAESSFDKTKWMMKDDHHYPYRDQMLKVLLDSHQLDSLKQDEVIDLLGQPDRIDNNHLFYTITQKRLGFWPLHTKTLVLKFSEDSKIEWLRIHE